MIRKNDLIFVTRLFVLVAFMLGIQAGVVLGLSMKINTPIVAEAADLTSITITRKNGKKIIPPASDEVKPDTQTNIGISTEPDNDEREDIVVENNETPIIKKNETGTIEKVNILIVPETKQMKIEYNEEIDTVVLPKEEVKEKDTLGDTITVPSYCGTFKAYMSFRAITNSNSKQYKLQQSENMWTDSDGMERYNDDYVVAVGKYFAGRVGDRLLVHMENGTDFTVIVGDFKALKDTDAKNMYTPGNKSIIEFLVDTKKLNKTVKKMGDVSYLPTIDMSGKVASIQKITNVSDEIAALYK